MNHARHPHPAPAVARAVVAALALLWTGFAVAAPEAGKTFKDWVIACEDRTEEVSQCYMVQNVMLRENRQRLIHVAVGFAPEGARPIAVFTVPLGVFLPAGVGVAIDGADPTRIEIAYCIADGCRAATELDADTVRRLQAGRQAQISFEDRTRRAIGVPVSLLGFTAALAHLRQ